MSNIRIVHDLTQDLWVIHAKFQSSVITVTAVIYKIRKIQKNSEKFGKIRKNSNFEFRISE